MIDLRFTNDLICHIRFSNNGLTISQVQLLTSYLAEESCPITNLFLDWNPIYQDDFAAGDSVPAGQNQLHELAEPTEEDPHGEISPFAKLIAEGKKL